MPSPSRTLTIVDEAMFITSISHTFVISSESLAHDRNKTIIASFVAMLIEDQLV